ncbi:MAG: ABC transporter permease [Spirochaetales bacterium]|jgi:simple sugar transport system permease protein|nr:ABC transporter permease [Spirochaetales bacterium]
MDKIKALLRRKEVLSIAALSLLLLFNVFFTPGFFSLELKEGHFYGSLIDVLKRGAPLMFMAIGMTFVIATGSTDISVGSVAAIAGAVAAQMIGGDFSATAGTAASSLTPLPLAIGAALLTATLCGVWNGFLVSYLGVQALIATLMLQVAGRGIAQLVTRGNVITMYYKPFFEFGTGYFLGLPICIYVVLAVALIAYLFSKKTSYGLFLESSGSNRSSTRYAGIKVQTMIWIAFAISGLMAGIAGVLIASEVKAADANNAGLNYELDAILAVVLGGNSMKGGRFSLAGSLIGALLVQALTTTIYMKGVPAQTILVVKAVVVILVGIIQTTNYRKLLARFVKKQPSEAFEVGK